MESSLLDFGLDKDKVDFVLRLAFMEEIIDEDSLGKFCTQGNIVILVLSTRWIIKVADSFSIKTLVSKKVQLGNWLDFSQFSSILMCRFLERGGGRTNEPLLK